MTCIIQDPSQGVFFSFVRAGVNILSLRYRSSSATVTGWIIGYGWFSGRLNPPAKLAAHLPRSALEQPTMILIFWSSASLCATAILFHEAAVVDRVS